MVSVPDVNDNTLFMVPQRLSYIVVEKEECEITTVELRMEDEIVPDM